MAAQSILAPEVVQSSAMDCGPASLKCLLSGFGISVSYGRLREACQTDVDGTSIDTLEDIACQLGLDAEQIMVPADHFFAPESSCLPALVVVRLPNGFTHFVVVWRRHGPFVQVMDPAGGRRWTTCKRFLDELYIHRMPVPASAWREHAASHEFLAVLRRRLQEVGVSRSARERLLEEALADPDWEGLGTLDAATRMVASIVAGGGLRPGPETTAVLTGLISRARSNDAESDPIPAPYFCVRPTDPDEDGEPRVLLCGAVLVRVLGIRDAQSESAGDASDGASLPPDLVDALAERPPRPGRRLLSMLKEDGLLSPAMVVGGIVMGSLGVLVESLLFRAFFDMGDVLELTEHRLAAIVSLSIFVLALLALEIPVALLTLRVGRHLEARLRIAFQTKIPRLADRYFHSRLTSDMAERAHAVHSLRALPQLGTRFIRASCTLMATVAGIAWLDPQSAPIAAAAAAITVVVPFAAQSLLAERDMRVRTHIGALSAFYLDALLGLVTIRTHGAERSVVGEHEGLLCEWERAGLGLQRAVVLVEAAMALLGLGLAAGLLFTHVARAGETGSILLLIYWALSIPTLGKEVALSARQYPTFRNVALRLFEPLDAREAPPVPPSPQDTTEDGGVEIDLAEVAVRAGGHTILRPTSLAIGAGEHVAIVGASGAGKSTLVGLLLGWHEPASGVLRVDGSPLDNRALPNLRKQTAWVDPAIQLWNRTLLENLRYGAPDELPQLGQILAAADLRPVLERLPDGLQTELGEGGALVSGGEGQRVRLGRALLRSRVRLAILDEPFRGLDRPTRHKLLSRTRAHFADATLLCVTHDVSETLSFKRVLVIDDGRIVEDGAPKELAEKPDSRYTQLLEADRSVHRDIWGNQEWRRYRMEEGTLREVPS